MTGKHIAVIYFYIISAFSLVLIVVGIYNVATFLINTTQYQQYPLRYQETDCNLNPYQFKIPTPYNPAGAPIASPSSAELSTQIQSCQKQLDLLRKQQQLDDLKSAVVFGGVGIALFLIHFPQARKQSR